MVGFEEIKTRKIADCIGTFVKEKAFSIPAQLIFFFTFCLGVGYFSNSVSAEKFQTMCSLYQILFPIWAAAGIGNKIVNHKNGDKK